MKKTSKKPETGAGSTALVVDDGRIKTVERKRWVAEWQASDGAWYESSWTWGEEMEATLAMNKAQCSPAVCAWRLVAVEVVERRTVVKEVGVRSTTERS